MKLEQERSLGILLQNERERFLQRFYGERALT